MYANITLNFDKTIHMHSRTASIVTWFLNCASYKHSDSLCLLQCFVLWCHGH